MKVLLTSTSFQDCEGSHKDLLLQQDWEISYLRGPLTKSEIIDMVADFDALICGDDELDREVLVKGAQGNLKYISKYGVGLDKIDLIAAQELGIPVTNCLGVNQVAVAEHVLAMLFSFCKNIHLSHQITTQGQWKRPLGRDLYGKKIGIVGLGAIGMELAKRTPLLGLETYVFDLKVDRAFVEEFELKEISSLEKMFQVCDIISLHIPLVKSTKGLISRKLLMSQNTKRGLILINTSRAGIISEQDIVEALNQEVLGGYLTDVLEIEPISQNCVLKNRNGVLITPHIGSRTIETIERQGLKAVENLINLSC